MTKPNTNTRFIDTAQDALHMNNDDISHLRMLVSIELLLAEVMTKSRSPMKIG